MNKKMINGTYDMHVGNYDWGCGVDRAVLTLSEAVSSVDPGAFQVSVRKMETDKT